MAGKKRVTNFFVPFVWDEGKDAWNKYPDSRTYGFLLENKQELYKRRREEQKYLAKLRSRGYRMGYANNDGTYMIAGPARVRNTYEAL